MYALLDSVFSERIAISGGSVENKAVIYIYDSWGAVAAAKPPRITRSHGRPDLKVKALNSALLVD